MADKDIGDLVKSTRREVGLSQAALARSAGTSRQYISGIERGEWTPSAAQARSIAVALGLPPGALGGNGASLGAGRGAWGTYQPSLLRSVDEVGIRERAQKFTKRSIKTTAKEAGIKLCISMMDLTTLEGKDTAGKVANLCQKAMNPLPGGDCPPVAAVCVYPALVQVAKEALGDSGVHVAAVATYFPSGQASLSERLEEVRRTVDVGADEIDMVISRRAFLQGEYALVFDEIAATREACGEAHLKVILEVGELETFDNVRMASQIAIDAGAHFIKTSTGKIPSAATIPVTLVMLETIRDHYLRTGEMVGMKPAGGIRTSKEALHYLAMVKETLGDGWLTPDMFRFGASSLLNEVLMQLDKVRTGRYSSTRYYSLP
jgi:deoxyribose-phosphate aldolase